jgi:hypothetical protein
MPSPITSAASRLLDLIFKEHYHIRHRKKNKALEVTIESHNQRLIELEKVVKELKP